MNFFIRSLALFGMGWNIFEMLHGTFIDGFVSGFLFLLIFCLTLAIEKRK